MRSLKTGSGLDRITVVSDKYSVCVFMLFMVTLCDVEWNKNCCCCEWRVITRGVGFW
jgi:hypothetical protein